MSKIIMALFICLLIFNPLHAQVAEELGQELTGMEAMEVAIFSNNEKNIESALEEALKTVKENPESYEARIIVATGYLGKADLLRIDRQTNKVTGDISTSYRQKQAELGVAGLVHAEKAKQLSQNKEEKSEAYRLAGELMVHRIDGPFSGMRFGPTAKSDIEYAITLDPLNWEAKRAQGLMFLNNPPINGGDLPKAVETFTECAAHDHDRDIYHALLAQAWVKRDRPDRAKLEAEKAILANPDNRLANNIRENLKGVEE